MSCSQQPQRLASARIETTRLTSPTVHLSTPSPHWLMTQFVFSSGRSFSLRDWVPRTKRNSPPKWIRLIVINCYLTLNDLGELAFLTSCFPHSGSVVNDNCQSMARNHLPFDSLYAQSPGLAEFNHRPLWPLLNRRFSFKTIASQRDFCCLSRVVGFVACVGVASSLTVG